MGKLLRVICCVAFVGLLASNLSAGTIVFSDDFELGLGSWTAPLPGTSTSALDISTLQNKVPANGSQSALVNSSLDRMYHNLGTEVTGNVLFTYFLYDGAQTRAFAEIRANSGAGVGDGSLQQLFAIGRYISVTMAGEVFDGTKYQGRLTSGAVTGWFNLNAPGAPSRSTGWHQFDVEVLPSGTDIKFYVDGVLSRTIAGATAATYDSLVIGSVGAGSTAGDSFIDGISVSVVPEPGSVALLISGLVALAGLALVRVRRRSA